LPDFFVAVCEARGEKQQKEFTFLSVASPFGGLTAQTAYQQIAFEGMLLTR